MIPPGLTQRVHALLGPHGYLPLPDVKPGETVVVETKFTAASSFKTKLLIGSVDAFEVKLDGKSVGSGAGQGRSIEPDRESLDVDLTKGDHVLRIDARDGAAIRDVAVVRITAIENSELVMVDAP
jgi:hypothetical protein